MLVQVPVCLVHLCSRWAEEATEMIPTHQEIHPRCHNLNKSLSTHSWWIYFHLKNLYRLSSIKFISGFLPWVGHLYPVFASWTRLEVESERRNVACGLFYDSSRSKVGGQSLQNKLKHVAQLREPWNEINAKWTNHVICVKLKGAFFTCHAQLIVT